VIVDGCAFAACSLHRPSIMRRLQRMPSQDPIRSSSASATIANPRELAGLTGHTLTLWIAQRRAAHEFSSVNRRS
jgi:hypothetical protein